MLSRREADRRVTRNRLPLEADLSDVDLKRFREVGPFGIVQIQKRRREGKKNRAVTLRWSERIDIPMNKNWTGLSWAVSGLPHDPPQLHQVHHRMS